MAMNAGFANYLANKKKGMANTTPAAPTKAPAQMASSKVVVKTPKHTSSGKMAKGTGVKLGTTVHKPGQGHGVSHPL